MPRPDRSLLAALTADLADLELGPLTDDERARTTAWVVERVDAAGEVTRLGLGGAGLVLAAAVRLRTGSAYAALPPARRTTIARRLASTGVPPAVDYVRAIRSLAVSYLYELRYASVPR